MADLQWWQTAVFYQIYPRSFADGNGDGIGDFIGMAQKLDYLKDLGVDALWLSPHFPSPQFDVGYDISDYTGVAPEYGTLDDFQRFLDGAHQRGLRVILDLVLNHTSHLHPWFQESQLGPHSPKRDWYIWRPGRDGGPPNNWCSLFGGSAWEYDPASGEYYYHMFLKEQPDLNWRNPAVQAAMWAAVRFWLDLGVDGYRLDAIGTVFENPDLTNHRSPLTQAELLAAAHTATGDPNAILAMRAAWDLLYAQQIEQPGVHALMQALRGVVDEYPDRVLVGESEDIRYHGDGANELHLTFNFPLMWTNRLTPGWIRANQVQRLAALPPGAWPCNTLGNHDSSRVYSRFGDGQHDDALARLSLALVLTLKGTPFLYNGEELGMADYHLPDISLFRDPPAVWFYLAELAAGVPPEQALARAARHSRDRCRTPMPWANAPNAGFSPAGVKPWLPVNPDFAPPPAGRGVNVADQAGDPASLLHFYRRLLRLRRATPALIAGDYEPLNPEAADYLAFLRRGAGQACVVILNYSDAPVTVKLDVAARTARCLFSTSDGHGAAQNLSELTIAPFGLYVGAL
jgi:alpha-glucosidase